MSMCVCAAVQGNHWVLSCARASRLKCLAMPMTMLARGFAAAKIAIRPMVSSPLESRANSIIGNTVLYGATSGQLFAAGQAGERFAVRNSGADVVVEGCGANGCEYMTGGNAVILGSVGSNFGAGMTGGMAFILDMNKDFEKQANPESIIWQRLDSAYWEGHGCSR